MMRLLGIPFVKSDGEAEAMCAWLNENNVSYLGAVEISNSQCIITPSSCFNVSFTIYVTVGSIIGIQSTGICDSAFIFKSSAQHVRICACRFFSG